MREMSLIVVTTVASHLNQFFAIPGSEKVTGIEKSCEPRQVLG